MPEVEFIINSQVTCDGSTGDSLCSGNATCIDGDLGVYCRCYVRELSQEEVRPLRCGTPAWLHLQSFGLRKREVTV